MSRLKVRIIFLAGLTASLVLTGCGAGQPTADYSGNSPAEQLLRTQQGPVKVEGEVDPEAAHLAARSQVNPKELASPHSYTTTPTAEDIDKDTNVRVVRLENQVASLRQDFKKLMPTLSPSAEETLASSEAAEDEAQEMDKNMKMQPAIPVAETMPDNVSVPAAPPQPQGVMPAAGNAASAVTGVRVGEHPDKTRIVLDMTAPGAFSYDLDNNEKLLLIELPQSDWKAAASKALEGNPLINGYSVNPSPKGGVSLAVELKKPVKLTLESAMPPSGEYGHRIVFDVAPL